MKRLRNWLARKMNQDMNGSDDPEAAGQQRRHSRALEPELISDALEKARAEARNGLKQTDLAKKLVKEAVAAGAPPFKLRPSLILDLHREALTGISRYAGNWRPAGVQIELSRHTPPDFKEVPGRVEDLCDYVNSHWAGKSPIHLGAYAMWRLNWIHPFADGNGRTARALSSVVMSVRAGVQLPGTPTIADLIKTEAIHANEYYAALDAADAAEKNGKLDISHMEELLGKLLGKQLSAFHVSLGGTGVHALGMP
jgi:Fic family protein